MSLCHGYQSLPIEAYHLPHTLLEVRDENVFKIYWDQIASVQLVHKMSETISNAWIKTLPQ